MKNVFFYNYPIGMVGIAEDNGVISHVFFGSANVLTDYEIGETPLIQRAATQLTEYFKAKRTNFDLPLSLKGTDFQLSVWKALQTIPSGETRSYKDIAMLVGNPKASRAVGMANRKNPIVIIIPCHRVIGQDGSMTGFAGGISVKEYLLALENPRVGGNR